MSGDAPALELRGITKRFGPLVANNAIDFELKRGELPRARFVRSIEESPEIAPALRPQR